VQAIELAEPRDRADSKATLPIRKPGWCLLRAWTEGPSEWVLDAYPYATTSPIYVTVAGQEPRSPEDDRHFLEWIDRIRESVEQHRDWNSPSERSNVLEMLERARAVYLGHGRIGQLHPETHGGVSWPVVP
jgi:hypothetical protein